MNKLKFTFNLIIILPTKKKKKTQKNQPIIEPPLN